MVMAGSASAYSDDRIPDDGVETPAYDYTCTYCGAHHGGVYSKKLCAQCYIKYPWLR